MGKNKRAAKAAWRAAATAAMHLPPITSPAPSLVALVTAHDVPALIDSKKPTPAPKPQPPDVHAQNARPAPRTSSLSPHTASASSNKTPASRSHPAPPFATESEPDRCPTPTTCEPRETQNERPQPAPPTISLAPQTPPATPRDSPMPHRRALRPNAAEIEMKEGSGQHGDKVRTESNAHGGYPHPVRTPAPSASRPHATTTHGIPTPHDYPATPFVSERKPATPPALATSSPASRTTTHDAHDVHVSPTGTTHRRATSNEPDDRRKARRGDTSDRHSASSATARTTTLRDAPTQSRSPTLPYTAVNEPAALAGARPGDTHGTRGTNTHPAPSSTSPTSRKLTATTLDVPTSVLKDTQSPTPGFEPGKPQAAAALLFEEPDGELLDPAYLKEIVATALRDGHAAGLKEGRNAGFREGLEAGKRTGRAEGHKQGLQEGLARIRLEASQDARAVSPVPHSSSTATPRVSSIDAIDEQLLREIRYVAYNSGFADGLTVSDRELESAMNQARSAGYAKGCEEESRRSQDRRPEHADAQTETTVLLTVSRVDAHTQTCPSSANSAPPAFLSWADEADSLPIHSVPPLPAPRDFSVLRSSSRSPFASLQRRARRSHRSDLHPPRSTFSSVPVITRRHPAGLRADRPSTMHVSSPTCAFAVPPSPLSWDGDPRLVELSRVLQSLGWVRGSSC